MTTMTKVKKLVERLKHAKTRYLTLTDYEVLEALVAEAASTLESLDRRVAELEGATAWKTIDSAPRDGAMVLLICADAYSPRASEGWWGWWNNSEGWQHFSRAEPGEKLSSGVYRWFPTHWMPLPDPPGPCEGRGREGGEA